MLPVMLFVLLGGTLYGIGMTPSWLNGDFTKLAQEEERVTESLRLQHAEEYAVRDAQFETDLGAIDAGALCRSAAAGYREELSSRKSYDKRFALTPREEAQLQMQSLASDSTRSFHDAVRAVAQKASPQGADVAVREAGGGLALYIDFDMSSMTSGEHGTRTKHLTKESLRQEVISIMSRVTNDVFKYCRDLDLTSIHVGCRHIVAIRGRNGTTSDENTILYKVGIQKNRITQLSNNPFLDHYSTTRHFEVEEDGFGDIEIVTTRR